MAKVTALIHDCEGSRAGAKCRKHGMPLYWGESAYEREFAAPGENIGVWLGCMTGFDLDSDEI